MPARAAERAFGETPYTRAERAETLRTMNEQHTNTNSRRISTNKVDNFEGQLRTVSSDAVFEIWIKISVMDNIELHRFKI